MRLIPDELVELRIAAAERAARVEQLRHRVHKRQALPDLPARTRHMAREPLHGLFLKIRHRYSTFHWPNGMSLPVTLPRTYR